MSQQAHDAWLQEMGVSEDEDRRWHEEHRIPQPRDVGDEPEGPKAVNLFAIGGAFLSTASIRDG